VGIFPRWKPCAEAAGSAIAGLRMACDLLMILSMLTTVATSRSAVRRDAGRGSLVPLLQPRSVAVIGASRTPAALGRRVLDALLADGFKGRIYPVNPQTSEIAGLPCFHSVRELPHGVDLAVIAVPRDAVLQVVDECGAAGVQSLVVITAGFGETGEVGRRLEQNVRDRVREYGMRMVGPNCMGLLNTRLKLNASFSSVFPPAGPVSLSSQSGALGIAILELARARHLGLSTFVSIGNKADISSNDLLEYWEHDPDTSVIMLYLESFGNPRKFAQLARRIGKHKPIVAVKAGRTRAGLRAASSHTAALAASDAVVDELFRASGVIRANTIDEMFDVAACLSAQPLPKGRRVAVVTNAGGPGILAVDACEGAGLTVVEFSSHTRQRLAEFLPPAASLLNPVDMVASADAGSYRRAITIALDAEETDALIVIYTPVDPAQSAAILDGIAWGVADARAIGRQKPVLACLLGGPAFLPLAGGSEQIPVFAFPENAARALSRAADHAEWRATSEGGLWTFADVMSSEARAICADAAAARGDSWLTPEELARVFHAYQLPLISGTLTRDPEEAAHLATIVGFPVVAKLSADGLLHKTDIGGVRTSLGSADAVRHAVSELLEIAKHAHLSAAGVVIQPMLTEGVETMIGAIHDPLFGALVGFGTGGTDVEIEKDVHFRPAPLTDRDAADLVNESRARVRLAGYRGRPPADVEALNELLLRISQLAEEIPELLELDLNPVIVLPAGRGCAIVDARMKVGRT
jgi:acetyl coenzyme A synthetase (ADP forming)-like protein